MTSALLTPDEAARRLGVGLHAIYLWGRSGKLRRVKVGRLVRFTEEAIVDFVAESTAHAEAIRKGATR